MDSNFDWLKNGCQKVIQFQLKANGVLLVENGRVEGGVRAIRYSARVGFGKIW